MEIRFHEKLYKDKISDFQMAGIRRRIKKKSLKLNVYLVTLPLGDEGVLEVYWYPELLQSAYRQLDKKMLVVGISKDRQSAFMLVKQIVEDVNSTRGDLSIKEFFEENT